MINRRTLLAAIPAIALIPSFSLAKPKLVSPIYTWQEDLVQGIRERINSRWSDYFGPRCKRYDEVIKYTDTVQMAMSINCKLSEVNNSKIQEMEDVFYKGCIQGVLNYTMEHPGLLTSVSKISIYGDTNMYKLGQFAFYGHFFIWQY